MIKHFIFMSTDGDLAKKKIEEIFIKVGFKKIDDGLVSGEEDNIYKVTEELDKQKISYAICRNGNFKEAADDGLEIPF